ncbi:hypothetical protein ABZU32_31680 [Sphaerisporangium sp. NPDC005288]|uniref:hypothetical protein n=1 Tax=Sphaerisporangium sp. NPDC005288 TaxID=3155114 RepID=UPI0033A54566
MPTARGPRPPGSWSAGSTFQSRDGAARALAILARRNNDLAEEVLTEELPWTTWLPDTERHVCVAELLGHLVAGADTGELVPFSRALTSWRSTAIAWSDPDVAHHLQGPFPGDGGEATRPAVPSP